MATRFSGKLVIRVLYQDSGDYKCSVSSEGKTLWSGVVCPAPAGFGAGVAYDSSEAYDQIAKSALAFAGDDTNEIEACAAYASDGSGYEVTRKPSEDL